MGVAHWRQLKSRTHAEFCQGGGGGGGEWFTFSLKGEIFVTSAIKMKFSAGNAFSSKIIIFLLLCTLLMQQSYDMGYHIYKPYLTVNTMFPSLLYSFWNPAFLSSHFLSFFLILFLLHLIPVDVYCAYWVCSHLFVVNFVSIKISEFEYLVIFDLCPVKTYIASFKFEFIPFSNFWLKRHLKMCQASPFPRACHVIIVIIIISTIIAFSPLLCYQNFFF